MSNFSAGMAGGGCIQTLDFLSRFILAGRKFDSVPYSHSKPCSRIHVVLLILYQESGNIVDPTEANDMDQLLIKQFHNGLIKCPLSEVRDAMPGILPIIDEAPVPHTNYVVDAKVHMLMPNQFPCIPNWHGDAIPRDSDLTLRPDLADASNRLFMWISNDPLPEFEDAREVLPEKWIEFGQLDIHRGTISSQHIWRLFIRLMPSCLVARPRTGKDVLRRHTQVYLDCSQFTW